jgi:hypothetical protein
MGSGHGIVDDGDFDFRETPSKVPGLENIT